MKSFKLLLACLLMMTTVLVSVQSVAQPGSIDPTFNQTDVGFGFGDGFVQTNNSPSIRSTAVQPDGKIIVGGAFTSYNGVPQRQIARLNADATIDESFDTGVGPNLFVLSVLVQPDGKILIGGDFNNYNGSPHNRIVRLTATGALDPTFNPGSGASSSVRALALQPDGKVIIAGDFINFNGVSRRGVARLNEDGSLDATFDVGTGALPSGSSISSMCLQPDGKVIIVGNFTSYNGTGRNRVARLNTDGSLDLSFDVGTGANSNTFSTAVQADGKVLIGGNFTTFNGVPQNRFARLNSDGSLDATFTIGTLSGAITSITLQSDGRVIIGGSFLMMDGPTTQSKLGRLNPDGSLDVTFIPTLPPTGTVNTTALQSNGKIIVGGEFIYPNAWVHDMARVNSDGSLDTSFSLPGTGANFAPTVFAVQPDGKIFMVGDFTFYNNTPRNRVARINADGSLDLTFDPGAGPNGPPQACALQSDGKLIMGGFLTNFNGVSTNGIARLNTNGTFDASFVSGLPFGTFPLAIAIQPDGKIIVGGDFTTYGGAPRSNIVRVNADGSLDASFNPGAGANFQVLSVAVQADGKITIGGQFTSYNGIPRNRIARLNSDGSLDMSFNPGSGANTNVFSVAVQPDGKVLIVGSFSTFNGISRNRIARLNADGSLDATFNPGTGVNGSTEDFVLQPDGKVIVGGQFISYNGTARNSIARINTDGSLDTSFDPGTGPGGEQLPLIFSMTLQSNGRLIIGGNFLSYNGTGRNRLARIMGDAPPPPLPPVYVTSPSNNAVNIPTNPNVASIVLPGSSSYTIDLSETSNFSVVAFTSTGTSPVRPFVGLKYNTKYYNRVKTNTTTEYGEVRNFTTVTASSLAFVTAPANGAVNVPTIVSLSSNVVPGAASYTIELSETSDFAVVAFTSTGATPVRPFAGLKYNQLYYNRVTTDLSVGAPGPMRSFTTMSASNIAVVTAPANGAVNVPTVVSLTSNFVPGASSYTIELSETSNFAVVAFSSTGASPVRPFFGLKYNQQYFNRVTTDVSGGAFGQVRSFTTQPATNLAFVTSPANGAVNVATVVSIVSNVVPGAGSYTIELSETSDFAVVAFTSTGASPVRPFYGLKYNQQYFNRVTTDLSPGAFGLVKSFTTQPASNVAFVNSPANNAVNVGTNVFIVSNVVAGASSYTIELSLTSNFSAIAFTQTGGGPVLPFTGLSVSTTYFNRVLTDVSGGVYGAVKSFTTKSTPGGRMAFPDEVTAVEDERADFELRLHGNPFRERLVVVVESKLVDQAELNLTDMNGRTVHASLAKTNTEIEIGNSLASGIYLLRANAGRNIRTIRVVKLE